jgi:mRNA interferase MazF
VVVVPSDALKSSRIATVVCVQLISNLKWARAPGNVLSSAAATGLPKDSVANVAPIVALDKRQLVERVEKIPKRQLKLVLSGIDVIFGR